MNDFKPLDEKIREELEKGINRNDILPLDWAMDRINPILEQAVKQLKEESETFSYGDKLAMGHIIDKVFGLKLSENSK